ncbi:unnamed protein product, partial [Amoebophrya sp. A25]|eukprot:GSA25T00025628001.1
MSVEPWNLYYLWKTITGENAVATGCHFVESIPTGRGCGTNSGSRVRVPVSGPIKFEVYLYVYERDRGKIANAEPLLSLKEDAKQVGAVVNVFWTDIGRDVDEDVVSRANEMAKKCESTGGDCEVHLVSNDQFRERKVAPIIFRRGWELIGGTSANDAAGEMSRYRLWLKIDRRRQNRIPLALVEDEMKQKLVDERNKCWPTGTAACVHDVDAQPQAARPNTTSSTFGCVEPAAPASSPFAIAALSVDEKRKQLFSRH